jgi:hypothetical protein
MVTKYNNIKGLRKNVEEVTKRATMLNSVVSDWTTYFANAFNKGRIQRDTVKNIENTKNMRADIKIKDALTSQ